MVEGRVITERLKEGAIEAGVVAVLKRGDLFDICTVQHIELDGSWTVSGVNYDGPIGPGMDMCRLVVVSVDGVYPLKFNQWNKSIKAGEVDSEKVVNFQLIPAKFVKGHYFCDCSECNASFTGHKRQPMCEPCCVKNSVAKIIIDKDAKSNQFSKLKRPRMVSGIRCQEIANAAYKLGKEGVGELEYEEWLQKQS